MSRAALRGTRKYDKITQREVLNMEDYILVWIITLLSFAAASLRVLLAKKQGRPNTLFWTVQGFVFPILMLLGLVLYGTGTKDILFPAVMLGLLEEIVFGIFRRRTQKRMTAPKE